MAKVIKKYVEELKVEEIKHLYNINCDCSDCTKTRTVDDKAIKIYIPNCEQSYFVKNDQVRQFDTGATRDTSVGKLEFARFMHPLVIKRFAEYMDLHRKQTDGNLREPDNWQKLFGDKHEDVCMDSLWRHLMDVWLINKGSSNEAREDIESALCAIMFNVQAWLFKVLKDKQNRKEDNESK